MFEVLEQMFWWALLIVSVPTLIGCVIAFPILCEAEMRKEENRK